MFDVAAEVLVNDSGVAALHRTLCGAVGALGGVHGRPASHSFVTDDREFRKITPEGERSHLICPVSCVLCPDITYYQSKCKMNFMKKGNQI